MAVTFPEELFRNPHFSRYYRTWQKNELSIVFIPLAQICREQGLFAHAREICEKGLVHHPDSVAGRLMLARICLDRDEVEEARRIAEEVLRELPAQQEAQQLLQRIARCQQQTFENHSVPLQKLSLWENSTMAQIYADQGEKKIALQIVDKILAGDPENERALRLREKLKR